jgi:hypothetical protein
MVDYILLQETLYRLFKGRAGEMKGLHGFPGIHILSTRMNQELQGFFLILAQVIPFIEK